MEEWKIFNERLNAMAPSVKIAVTVLVVFTVVSLIAVPPAMLGFFMKVFGFSSLGMLVVLMWKDWTLLWIEQLAGKLNKSGEDHGEPANPGTSGTRGLRENVGDDQFSEEQTEDPPDHQGSRPDQ